MGPSSTATRFAKPPLHLCFPLPLVIDADAALLSGGDGDPSWVPSPATLLVNRAALELLRLQRRFRSPVLLLTAMPQEWALWLAETLGPGLMVQSTGRRVEDKAIATMRRYEVRGFDFLGGTASVSAIGSYARRLWHVGAACELKDRMRTSGSTLIMLDAEDKVPLSALGTKGGNWNLPSDGDNLPESPLSIKRMQRFAP